jgi:ParB family chromosome partitioning protein
MSKGLESLIPKKTQQNMDKLAQKESVFWVSINDIRRNPNQPRKLFKEEEIKSLAESIKKYGVLQPVILTKKNEKEFELVAGERRTRACRLLGLDKIPAIFKQTDERKKLELALIENVQREDLNQVERAKAFKYLKDQFGLTDKEIGEVAGKSRETVSNAMRILTLPEVVVNAIEKELITGAHAKILLYLKSEEDIKKFLAICINEKLDTAQLTKRIRDYQNPKPQKTIKDQAHLEMFENKFKTYFDYDNIKVKSNSNKYQVVLDFDSEDKMREWMNRKKI